MRRLMLIPLLAVLAGCLPPPAGKMGEAERKALRQEVRAYLLENPEIIDEMQVAYGQKQDAARKSQMADITKRYREDAAYRDRFVADAANFSIGPTNAKVTLVEFFDYRCPRCHESIAWVRRVHQKHPEVRIIFKEMPFLSQGSLDAARAALAAGRQGKYWQIHQELMDITGDHTIERINQAARRAGVDVARMQADMQDPAIIDHLKKVSDLAAEAGIEGTPTFLVNGEVVVGFDEPKLDAALAAALGGSGAGR
jgi:protein-disulfide isomerase